MNPKLSKKMLIYLRSALLFAVKAIEDVLWEGWGWTPIRSKAHLEEVRYTGEQ